jgi:spermidine/putrescine transport system permease protein
MATGGLSAVLGRMVARRRLRLLLLVLPPALWLLLFLVLPYLALLTQSFLGTDDLGRVVLRPTLEHYRSFFTKPLYYGTLLHTFRIAAIVTTICVALSVPLAYVIAFKLTRWKEVVYTLIIVPLWVSYIVRAYAWKIILGREGILNTFLLYVGAVDEPVEAALYSDWAMVVGLVHIFTPFVLMPVYTAFEHIPRQLMEASQDLGAGRITTFRRVVLPLALPGILAGATFAFVLTLGDFLAPLLLGGPDTLLISNIVQNLFGTSDDRPLGSVVGVVMLVIVVLILEMGSRAERSFASLESGKDRLGGTRA